MTPDGISIVVPTVGRPSLTALVAALAAERPPTGHPAAGVEILIVDDRRDHRVALPLPADLGWATVKVLTGRSAGPAAARNTGWRAARHEWVAFLDDDVLPDPGWLEMLVRDLAAAGPGVGGVQGRVRVPLPVDRRPTDWERVTAGLADGEWITADMAYRREALRRTGGFDERLPRAFREDAELAYRVRGAGWRLVRGARGVTHPVRPEGAWVSVRTQAGNADDALLRRLYGPRWRTVLAVPPGRRRRHAVITAAGLAAVCCTVVAVTRRSVRRSGSRSGGRSGSWSGGRSGSWSGGGPGGWAGGAVTGAAVWAALTTEFAAARIAGGPGGRREVATMLATSVVIPPVAVTHWLCGWWRWRGATPLSGSR